MTKKDNISRKIRERIHEARLKRKLSTQEVSDKVFKDTCSFGADLVVCYELGNLPPLATTLAEIADVLKVSLDWLTGRTDETLLNLYFERGFLFSKLPRPVKRDGKGKLVEDYTHREWFAKIMEEVVEASVEDNLQARAEELIDVITVCTSYLQTLGFDEGARSELYRRVNEKNRQRGYFEEAKS